jgi:hypothetical protein
MTPIGVETASLAPSGLLGMRAECAKVFTAMGKTLKSCVQSGLRRRPVAPWEELRKSHFVSQSCVSHVQIWFFDNIVDVPKEQRVTRRRLHNTVRKTILSYFSEEEAALGSLVNASTPPSRAAPHDSGQMWVATSHSCDSFIHYTSPVYPAHKETGNEED